MLMHLTFFEANHDINLNAILSLFFVSAHIWLEINQFPEVSEILFIANM